MLGFITIDGKEYTAEPVDIYWQQTGAYTKGLLTNDERNRPVLYRIFRDVAEAGELISGYWRDMLIHSPQQFMEWFGMGNIVCLLLGKEAKWNNITTTSIEDFLLQLAKTPEDELDLFGEAHTVGQCDVRFIKIFDMVPTVVYYAGPAVRGSYYPLS